MKQINELISPTIAAEQLGVSILAIGQAIADKRLHLCEGFTIKAEEVLDLQKDQAYLDMLRKGNNNE